MDVKTWVSRQQASHLQAERDEARRLAALTPEQRGELLAALCRSAMGSLRGLSAEEQRQVLDARDPLPAESIAALKRLRAAYRGPPRGG